MAEATTDPRWRNRIVGHGEKPPGELRANDANWRQHPQHQREAMREMLEEVGWVSGVMINRTTGNMIDGHLRVEEAIDAGEPLVPYDEVELSLEHERLVLAALDPLAALAAPDVDKLDKLLDELAREGGGALDGMLADLAQSLHSGQHLAPEDPSPETFWPRIACQVPPTVFKRWQKALQAQDKANDRDAISALLKTAGY